MSAPSTVKKALVLLITVVLTAAISVFATLSFMSSQHQATTTETAVQPANHTVYEELVSITKGTPLADCVGKYKNFKPITDSNHSEDYVFGLYHDSPDKDAQALVLHCSAQVRHTVYESAFTAYTAVPKAYGDQYFVSLPQWEKCYDSNTPTAGHQCVIDGLNTFVSGINAFAANELKLAQQRWQAWSNKWSQPSPIKVVADRLASLRQAFQAMPDIASAQNLLDNEVCINRGYSQEAALRLAIERELANFNIEAGVAANRIHAEYFGDIHTDSVCAKIKR